MFALCSREPDNMITSVSGPHILNILHRLIDGKPTDGPTISAPQTLLLRHEPKANVERYDDLRARSNGGRHAS